MPNAQKAIRPMSAAVGPRTAVREATAVVVGLTAFAHWVLSTSSRMIVMCWIFYMFLYLSKEGAMGIVLVRVYVCRVTNVFRYLCVSYKSVT